MITPILIVDDSLAALAASGLLRRDAAVRARYGLDDPARRIQIVSSAHTLWAWLDQQPIGVVELVLLDQHLPDARGDQLVAPLRAHVALAPAARLIGWSSLPDVAPVMRAAGADGFVWKLVDPDLLVPQLWAIVVG